MKRTYVPNLALNRRVIPAWALVLLLICVGSAIATVITASPKAHMIGRTITVEGISAVYGTANVNAGELHVCVFISLSALQSVHELTFITEVWGA